MQCLGAVSLFTDFEFHKATLYSLLDVDLSQISHLDGEGQIKCLKGI